MSTGPPCFLREAEKDKDGKDGLKLKHKLKHTLFILLVIKQLGILNR